MRVEGHVSLCKTYTFKKCVCSTNVKKLKVVNKYSKSPKLDLQGFRNKATKSRKTQYLLLVLN